MTYKQETIKPYNATEDKGRQVERMFDNIAHSYDLLNRLLSLGIDRRWRRAAIRSLAPYSPQTMLDVATGTGDFALLSARMLRPKKLIGVDLSEGMLDVARSKLAKMSQTNKGGFADDITAGISFQKEDGLQLSFADATFDAVTVAYGIRNFEDLDRGLTEMLRVLKPGGHLVIIELTAPARAPMRQLFHFYSHSVMPLLGRLVSHDARAYSYLPATMESFPQGEVMQGVLEHVGFTHVTFKRFTFGLSTLYVATK